MGTSLGEHVVEIVANGDEVEALLVELSDAVGAEEEDAKHDTVLLGGSLKSVGGLLQLGRGVHLREDVLLVETHGHAEVILAKECDIHSGDGHDLLDVLDGVVGLNLEGDDDVLVSVGDVAEETSGVSGGLGEVDRASAAHGVEAAGDGFLELSGGVDVGDEDTIGSQIEGLLDSSAVLVAADTDHGLSLAVIDGADHVAQGAGIHGPVLSVDEKPVVARVAELGRDGWGGGVEEETHLGDTSLELSFELGTSLLCGHIVSKVVAKPLYV